MTHYTTGELAKLCNVTVRTVQYYDSKNLLNPSELSDGGRRIYTDEDLSKLRIICFLKELEFPLKDISTLLNDADSDAALRFILDSQQQRLAQQVERDRTALTKLHDLQRELAHFNSVTPKAFGVIADIMNSKKKLRNMRVKMVLVGLVMDAAWIAPIVIGIVTGTWWPLAIGIPVAVILGVLISRYYISHTAYVCPECHVVFRPPLKQNLLAAHTPSMRKLTCPVCGFKGYCLEVYAPDSAPLREGKYLIWPDEGEKH